MFPVSTYLMILILLSITKIREPSKIVTSFCKNWLAAFFTVLA